MKGILSKGIKHIGIVIESGYCHEVLFVCKGDKIIKLSQKGSSITIVSTLLWINCTVVHIG